MDFTTGLLETMYVFEKRIALEDYHKKRLENGLELYDFKMDAERVFAEINKSIERHDSNAKELKVQFQIFPTPTASSMQIKVSEFSRSTLSAIKLGFASGLKIDSLQSNNLKTSQRTVYNQALEQAQKNGLDDLLLCNERGEIVESGIFNLLWLSHENGQWYTPPLRSGCVAGVQRQYLLDSGKLKEKDCYPQDLLMSKSLMVCNALRGVLAVDTLRY